MSSKEQNVFENVSQSVKNSVEKLEESEEIREVSHAVGIYHSHSLVETVYGERCKLNLMIPIDDISKSHQGLHFPPGLDEEIEKRGYEKSDIIGVIVYETSGAEIKYDLYPSE